LRLSKEGEQTLAKAVVMFYKSDFLKNFPPQLLDFYNAKPSYHGYPALNFEKVYSEEENKMLLEFISKGGVHLEGAECE
jgi:hypothetical protein